VFVDKGNVYSTTDDGRISSPQERSLIDYIRILSFDRKSSRELFQVLKKNNLLVSTKSLPPNNRPTTSNNNFVSTNNRRYLTPSCVNGHRYLLFG